MEEVDLCPVNNPEDPEEWEKEIGKGGAYIFSDGSLLENGNVGGGAFIVSSRGEVESGIGNVATVWNSEIAGMAGGLARVRRERKSSYWQTQRQPSRRSGRRVGQERPNPETYREWLTWLWRLKRGRGRSNWGG